MSSGAPRLRILLVGGYGTFGSRLARLLADDPRLTLLIGGRSLARAQAFCTPLGSTAAGIVPAQFDRDRALATQLARWAPTCVVDASGPFQAYGDAPYRLVEACIDAGIPYLDLADSADFVAGIGRLDRRARAAGVFALSGLSTFPALSAAAARSLATGLAEVETVVGGAAPSPRVQVGGNVIRAIAGYAGRPVMQWRGGQASRAWPFTESRHFVIAPPGQVPLRRRLFALVEVPDSRLLPLLWPRLREVWIGAGTAPQLWLRLLIALAWLVRARVLPSLRPAAAAMHFAMRRLRWGEHRGGMFIEVQGRDAAGRARSRAWHLLAEGDSGPFVPTLAAAAVVQRLLTGQQPAAGARAATAELELADFEPWFDRLAIHTGTRERMRHSADAPLFERLLGSAWSSLAPELRALHGASAQSRWQGRADVERGLSLAARLLAACFGLPPAGRAQTLTVELNSDRDGERWVRRYGRHLMKSRLSGGRGADQWLLCERFGPFRFAMALVVEGDRLHYRPRGWRLLGLPLPFGLGPRVQAQEYGADGRFHFDVRLEQPWLGLIVHYRGWLAPSE
ncbi:MAG: DUF4166 domain-containing protein [Betaproteobacteria bacterium]